MVKSISLKNIIITLLLSLFANILANSQDTTKLTALGQFSFGAKIGLNYMRLNNLSKTYSIGDDIDHYYKPGYSIGLFLERDIFVNTSLSAELNYHSNNERIVLYTGYNGIIEKDIEFTYINIPILIKYKLNFCKNISIQLGPGFNIQLNAKQKNYDRIYRDKGEISFNKELPSFSTTLESGIGYNHDINNINILTEIRTQWDLVKKKFITAYDINNIGEWKNIKIAIILGVKF